MFCDLEESPKISAVDFRELYLLDVTAALAVSSNRYDRFLFGSGKQPQEEGIGKGRLS